MEYTGKLIDIKLKNGESWEQYNDVLKKHPTATIEIEEKPACLFLQSMCEAVITWRRILTVIVLLMAIMMLNDEGLRADASALWTLQIGFNALGVALFHVKQPIDEGMKWLAVDRALLLCYVPLKVKIGGYLAGCLVAVIVLLFADNMLLQFTLEGVGTTYLCYVGVSLALKIAESILKSRKA